MPHDRICSYKTQPPHDRYYWFHRPSGQATWDDPTITSVDSMTVHGGGAPEADGLFTSLRTWLGFSGPEKAQEPTSDDVDPKKHEPISADSEAQKR